MTRRGLCNCGSGFWRFELTDARGIFCGYVCDGCAEAKRKEFRTEIFTDPHYAHDEPIEEDE